MKLLLTSGGLLTKEMRGALEHLLGKPFSETNVAFITTAANAEPGDKSWLIDDLLIFQNLGLKSLDIIDYSGLPQDIWLPRLEVADCLCFSGGNTYHLIHTMRQSGLDKIFPQLLSNKVYVGISAGSMVVGPTTMLSTSARLYSESVGEITDDTALNLVPFQIRPHLNSPWFPNLTIKGVREQAKESTSPIYVIDDDTAIQVEDDAVTIISTGLWEKIEPTRVDPSLIPCKSQVLK